LSAKERERVCEKRERERESARREREREPKACTATVPTAGHKSNFYFFFVYKSILGDLRLWVGPRIEHLLSS